jgi:hypothetical protein
MEWYGQVKHDSSESEVVLLLYDFLVPAELEKPLEETIRRLAGIRRWKSVVFIGGKEMSRIMRRKYSKSVHEIVSAIGEASFDEIFIARDFVGAGSALILNAYPDATRIIYGDGLGLVGYESDFFHRGIWSLTAMRSNFRAFCRRAVLGGPKRFKFDAAVLTIPIDWSGSYLWEMPLLVPDRVYSISVLKECIDRLPDLQSYCTGLVEESHDPHLFLLSTLSGAGLMSVKNEIDLYVEIVRQAAPTGSTIFLKTHPRCQEHILASVLKELEPEYRVKVIDDPQFSRIPIELWVPLVTKCRIVTVLSSSCILLSYFYGKETVFSLNESNIGRRFSPEWISYVTKLSTINRESSRGLKEWDGKSPLWRGPESVL